MIWYGHSLGKSGRKTHKHKQISRIILRLGAWQNLFMCFLGVIPYGEKDAQENLPRNPETILRKIYLCVFVRLFFRSQGKCLVAAPWSQTLACNIRPLDGAYSFEGRHLKGFPQAL